MEIRVLRYFLAVVEEGSVTAAAARVHVAQPSLSRQLRGLEAELGIDLFTRSPGRLTLSPAGGRFLGIARDLVSRADGARAVMSALAEGHHVGLTAVAPPTTINDILAPYIAAAGADCALANVEECDPGRVYEVLERREADFAVCATPPPGGLEGRIVCRAPVFALAHPTHWLASRDSVHLTELLAEPIIVMGRHNGTRRLLDEAVTAAGLSYAAAHEVDSTTVGQALAAAGRGVAVLSDDPRFDLSAATIMTDTGRLEVTLYGAWDPAHYAKADIARTVLAISRFYEPQTGNPISLT